MPAMRSSATTSGCIGWRGACRRAISRARSGSSFQQVQKYEKGANRVGAGRLVRVAAALGVPVMALLKGVPGVAQKAAPPPDDLLATPGRMRLVQAFATIEDGAVRRALIALTEDAARIGAERKV